MSKGWPPEDPNLWGEEDHEHARSLIRWRYHLSERMRWAVVLASAVVIFYFLFHLEGLK